MRTLTRLIMSLAVVSIASVPGHAIPQLINYQGILTDALGTPIIVVTNVTFRIYDAPAGGDILWSETQAVTPDALGRFNILLGSMSLVPDSAFDSDAYLGVTVAGDPELSPRSRIVSTGYSYRVNSVDGALGGTILSDVNIEGKATIGFSHTNSAAGGFVAGTENFAGGSQSSVGGGNFNSASGAQAVTAGGFLNGAVSDWATVSGGYSNSASDTGATVGGGRNNRASARYATVSGGGGALSTNANLATGQYSTVGGGSNNKAVGNYSTIAGGLSNFAGGLSSVVVGGVGDSATASWSMVLSGWHSDANGQHSIAIGPAARAFHDGSVVITANDSPNASNDVVSSLPGQMVLMAAEQFHFTDQTGFAPIQFGRFINTSTGAYLTTGGTWTNSSDENKKENFAEIDRAEILDKIAALNIRRWNYKAEESDVQHIGPTAQQFHSLFHVGNDDKTISTIDPAGIALAAIQELHKRTEGLEVQRRQLEALKLQNARLERELASLRELMEVQSAHQ